jgi:Fe2+ or Zn2+ uptake regulation protein
MAIDTSHKTNDMRTEAVALHILSQIQEDAPEVRLKTLYDALKNYEKLADFKALSNIHLEIAQILSVTRPDEAFIHAHWAKLLSYSQGAAV